MIYANYSAIFYYFIPQLLSKLFRNFKIFSPKMSHIAVFGMIN